MLMQNLQVYLKGENKMHATQVLSFVYVARKLFDMKPGTHYSQTCIILLD